MTTIVPVGPPPAPPIPPIPELLLEELELPLPIPPIPPIPPMPELLLDELDELDDEFELAIPPMPAIPEPPIPPEPPLPLVLPDELLEVSPDELLEELELPGDKPAPPDELPSSVPVAHAPSETSRSKYERSEACMSWLYAFQFARVKPDRDVCRGATFQGGFKPTVRMEAFVDAGFRGFFQLSARGPNGADERRPLIHDFKFRMETRT